MKSTKQPATVPTTGPAIFPKCTITPCDVVRLLRDRAELRLEAWKQATNEDPLHAFQWGARDAIEAATMMKVCTYALQALHNGVKDFQAHCLTQAADAIRYPAASTGLLEHVIQSYTAAAWARIAADLRLEGAS